MVLTPWVQEGGTGVAGNRTKQVSAPGRRTSRREAERAESCPERWRRRRSPRGGELPAGCLATEPPESHGKGRDVARRLDKPSASSVPPAVTIESRPTPSPAHRRCPPGRRGLHPRPRPHEPAAPAARIAGATRSYHPHLPGAPLPCPSVDSVADYGLPGTRRSSVSRRRRPPPAPPPPCALASLRLCVEQFPFMAFAPLASSRYASARDSDPTIMAPASRVDPDTRGQRPVPQVGAGSLSPRLRNGLLL